MFNPVDSKVDFPAQEQETLAWWEENGIVEKYLKRNDASTKRFSFIDGPITANNPMGVHHGWGRTYKDLFQRFKTMQGYRQRYQNGFDGQGLWIEVEVEKELGFESKRDIEAFGIDKFVELCKQRVRKFADVQTWQSIQLGYWMDWDNSYHTMADENNYTIWHFLKVCHERGWIYEGTDVMPWCPRCGTGLSQHEIVTEGYKEITHPGLYLRFPLVDREGESLLVWTTTPWTLTSNTAAYVHPEFTYAKARTADGVFYLLKSRLSELKQEYELLEEMPGSALDGLRYRGPFDELPAQRGVERRVVLFDDVSEREGTGVVHAAPGAGEADFELSKREGLTVIAPLNEFGVFVDGFDWLTGRSVFEVNDDIYRSLRDKGLFYRLESYDHRYPVCWRCDTELVFRLVDEWFISMDELRDLIARVTRNVKWVPAFGLQRELDWLRNMDDWMISKKRYWGLALPIYKCECGHFEVIGSETELEARAIEGWDQFEGHSPHRPWIDVVKIQCTQCGTAVSRIRDVGNPWLDAGIVPFSTMGYRDDRAYWRDWFPGDLISESFPGQFRNWFYSLLTMSTVLEDSEPFKAVFSYAMMRDEHGEEMHKSKGNAIWFEDAAGKMGVDSMRWVYSRQRPEANLNFGFGVADGVRRSFLIPLWNVYSFFVTYANIDGYDPRTAAPPVEQRPELDRWIISELNELVADVTAALERYSPRDACIRVESFVGYLSNWYVRRSRRRFWKSEADDDKLAAHSTLYECLVTLTRLLAPFVPFVTEVDVPEPGTPRERPGRERSSRVLPGRRRGEDRPRPVGGNPAGDEAVQSRQGGPQQGRDQGTPAAGPRRSGPAVRVRALRPGAHQGPGARRAERQGRSGDGRRRRDRRPPRRGRPLEGRPALWRQDERRGGCSSGSGPTRGSPEGQRRASGRGGRIHAGAGRGLGDAHGRPGLRLGDGGGVHRRGHDGDQPRSRARGPRPGARARRPEHEALRGIRHSRPHRHVRHRRRGAGRAAGGARRLRPARDACGRGREKGGARGSVLRVAQGQRPGGARRPGAPLAGCGPS